MNALTFSSVNKTSSVLWRQHLLQSPVFPLQNSHFLRIQPFISVFRCFQGAKIIFPCTIHAAIYRSFTCAYRKIYIYYRAEMSVTTCMYLEISQTSWESYPNLAARRTVIITATGLCSRIICVFQYMWRVKWIHVCYIS